MLVSMSDCQQLWLLIFTCYLLYPLYTHSTPIQKRRGQGPCAHASIAELIKTSPVILKALGAPIYTDDDLAALQNGDSGSGSASGGGGGGGGASAAGTQQWLQSRRNAFLAASSTLKAAGAAGPAGASGLSTGDGRSNLPASSGDDNALLAPNKAESILITLTPETIYKGASLLKLTPGGGGGARTASASYYAAESALSYDGQLNATLEPLSCFDSNVLKILPTELIAFGKLVTVQQQQQEHERLLRQRQRLPSLLMATPASTAAKTDIFRISINGLHRWTPQFENHIWKHLGWDGWSDFTLCSVTCGKGVQQRFRRCLLDDPMVNLNMNLHLNAVAADVASIDDDDDNDIDDSARAHGDADDDADDDDNFIKDEFDAATRQKMEMFDQMPMDSNRQPAQVKAIDGKSIQSPSDVPMTTAAAAAANTTNDNKQSQAGSVEAETETEGVEDVMQIFLENASDETLEEEGKVSVPTGYNLHTQRKRHKSGKTFSTLFCEGYNIEQRNCNSFECSDDINDLLKFYRRLPTPDELNTGATAAGAAATVTMTMTVTPSPPVMTAAPAATANGSSAAVNALPSSTPANMGYVRSWRNDLNFTLMLTLRLKNDSRTTTATIFSIRNATHNLYLEPYKDGLRLYLERDNTTEMLPVKFNLYDYHWHQVAISIQNGDFISIYVDCSWTNSFIVSKRLFSLPLDADVEIGRGFNGELQQLLVLPDNQERQQCSNKRTSINEVKRYIIDTFIDDYAN